MCRIPWGSSAPFSFPSPSLYRGPDARQNHADSFTAWSEHKTHVTFWTTHATIECDVPSLWGEASSPACPSSAVVGFAWSQHHLNHQNAPRIYFPPLHKVSCGTTQAVTAYFGNTSERLTLTSWAGSVARACPQGCWGCLGALLPGQDKDVCTACIDSSWTQSWSVVSWDTKAPPAYLRISAIKLVQASLIKKDALMWPQQKASWLASICMFASAS